MLRDWLNMFTKAGKLKHVLSFIVGKLLRELKTQRQANMSKIQRPKRQETRRKKISTDRVDLFVSNYVQNKYPDIYKEASQFYDELRLKNPEKLDLRKSISYRSWLSDQKHNIIHGNFNKFKLNVQLMNTDDVRKNKTKPLVEGINEVEAVGETLTEGDGVCENPTEASVSVEILDEGESNLEVAMHESTLEVAMHETLNLNTTESALEPPLSDELFEQILENLREDPDLFHIIKTVEEEILYQEFGLDVDVSDDERLEYELM